MTLDKKTIAIGALILVIVCGCGPSYKLRRAEKLIKKAELQGATWGSDTVFTEVPVVVKETRVDTVVSIQPGDSVVIFKDRVEVKIKRLRGDTVYVDAKCKADTIKVKVPVNVYRTITAKGWLRWWHLVVAFLVGAVVGRLFLKMLI